ncbi:MAG: Rieske 2Fe-2S domain-containing protein [Bacteroidota bacterium]
MKRRNFVRRAALSLVSLAGALTAFSYLRQFFPRLAEGKRRIALGDPRQFPVDTYTFLDAHKLFVYRDHEGVKAVSAVCTHLGCILEKSAEGFECPCHGSCFNDQGEVLSGPAPRDLAWYRVSRSSEGKILVDPGTTVSSEDKFLTS